MNTQHFFWFNFLATLNIHFLATFYKPFNQVTFLFFECLYKVHHLKLSVRVVNKPLTDSIWIVLRVRADHLSANDHELYSSKDIVRLHERKVKTSWESSWQVLHHSFDFLDIQIHEGFTVTKFCTLIRVLALWNITFIIQSTYLSCVSCLNRSTKYLFIQNPIWNIHHYIVGVLHDIG